MRACSILPSATITVIERINKATDFKRLGVGRANVEIFYSFLFSHLVPTEMIIYRLIIWALPKWSNGNGLFDANVQ